ncbi:MAG TPA: hypothetical protein ENJ53_02825 [Phaeodactylibacter sp.]|nr:hypothetical protein [Phaeodactylibacter sp.]
MEAPIYIFEPDTFKSTLITVVFAGLSVAVIAFLYFYNKKEMSYEARKRKGLYSILLGIVLLLTTSTAVLNWWNSFTFKPVKIYSNAIEMPDGVVLFENITQAYIYTDRPPMLTSPPDSLMNYKRLLVIDELPKASHVVAEENYPILDILEKLEKTMGK